LESWRGVMMPMRVTATIAIGIWNSSPIAASSRITNL
jgi:hypothetical protein